MVLKTHWTANTFAESIASYLNQTCNFVSIESENLWNELSLLIISEIFLLHPYPAFLLYTERFLEVLKSLDGHGGDECLTGYPDMITIKLLPQKNRPLQTTLEDMLKTQHTPQNTMCLFC